MTVLDTPRLHLRRYQAGDADAVLAYKNDPEVARYQSWDLPFRVEHLDAWADERELGDEGWTQRVIVADGVVIGDVGVRGADRQAELGITLASTHQGRGYAAEALRAVTTYCIAARGCHRLFAGADPRNVAVVRLLLGLGWRHEGTSLRSYWHRGAWTDDATYAILAEEWQARYDDPPRPAEAERGGDRDAGGGQPTRP